MSSPAQASTKGPKPGLTLKRERIIAALADPSVSTQREAAKRAGAHETTVSVVLKDPTVAKELAKTKARQSDKAGGLLATVERLAKRTQKTVNQLEIEEFSAHDKIALLEKTLDLQRKALDLRALYPQADNLEQAMAKRAELVAKAVRVGRYLEVRAQRVKG